MCVGGGGGGGGAGCRNGQPPPPHTHTRCIFLALRSHFLHSGHIHSAIYLQKVHNLYYHLTLHLGTFVICFLLFHTDADEKCGMWVNLGRGDVRVGFLFLTDLINASI